MELQNTVKEALNALYHHPDDGVHLQADRWLQDFQRTLDAWQVADNLLHDATSNLETLIFCSQTLRSKVQRDFEELPSEAFHPLRDSLNNLLRKFHKGPPKVRTQISIAVAALAVHVSAEDWGDGGIVKWLHEEMNLHPEFIPGFLELLTVLPEEVSNYKIAARPERRRQFEKELTSQMEIALNILTACLNINELKEQVLEAFASWLRLKHGIPGSVLASHPLVLTALSSLNSELLSEAAVNVISELIHYTAAGSSGGVSVQMPLIQVLVPQVMNLKGQLRDSSKDEEDVKAITRLFSDMGDSYVELIATGSDESMLIVHALLEVASHPEYYIASMTFNFWHSLQVSSRIQYPQDYQDLSYEDLKEFKQTRYAVADVLMDAASVLGGDATLRILYMKLDEAAACCHNEQSEWHPAEAALFGIRAISTYVSTVEAEVMPKVMDRLLKLPQHPQLLQTVCLTIGAYSKWLDVASGGPSILPSVLHILMSGMGISDSAAAAAVAFRQICDDCRLKLSGCLDGLFHTYHGAVNGEGSFKVSADDSLHLVEALSKVITELPPDHAKRALEALCLPVVTPLQEVVRQGPDTLNSKPARDLTVHIDRFGYIFSRAWDMQTMESLCRACKYAVRTSGRYMEFTIGAMLEEIQGLYQQHHQPCFLYLSSEIFGSDPYCANYLKSLIEALFMHTTHLLTSIQEFTARPDIADDCFLLASRCIRYCPQLFIPSAVFPSLVDCSLIGITVQHREASKSILTFLSDIFDLANSAEGKQYLPIRNSVIIPRGSSITRILIASLTGALPSSRRELALSDAVSGADDNALSVPIEDLSDVCRRNRTVMEIVQQSLRPLELSIAPVS
ncbi:hypothetical protein DVH24_001665 [Malus domestica]|uniref:Importin N-terminal domain-containing protein n=1 Tax=Malus domestica TaxID=3750 RepID=A0A498HXA5_MALDO|nr:hypothetical protein DVH24_001665 [Malus domestica]